MHGRTQAEPGAHEYQGPWPNSYQIYQIYQGNHHFDPFLAVGKTDQAFCCFAQV